ncbi:hypothetical protein QE152_g4984 [Popillia japonica]|uniref:Uncharacterized protein n=1 Tax=Popillia japonica TaxID=7064 RepID=A0AAW1MYU8_POPJA
MNTAWTRVTSKTIENCFRHAGFLHNALFDEDDDLPLSQLILKYADDKDDDNFPLSTWIDRNNINNPFNNEDLTRYTNVDSELITTEAPSDAELIRNSFKDDLQEVMEDSDMEENAARLPTIGKVHNALNVLSTYISFTDVDHSIKYMMFNLLQVVMSNRNKSRKAALSDAELEEIIANLDNSEDELFDFSDTDSIADPDHNPQELDEDPGLASVA